MAKKTKKKVLIMDSSAKARRSLRSSLEGLGYKVMEDESGSSAPEVVDLHRPDIVVAGNEIADKDLCHYLTTVTELRPTLMVLFPRGTAKPGSKAQGLGADAGLTRPLSKPAFAAALDVLSRLSDCRKDARSLERRVEELGDRLERIGDRQSGHRFYHYDFFKHLLVIEIRRARRYRYPVSVCMLEVDPVRLPPGSLMVRGEIRTGVARAVSESIRDIDIPVYIGGETILLFLPHTAVPGAQKVAKRVSKLISTNPYKLEGDALKITASIGVCGIDTGQRLTFSQLIQKAQKALVQAKQQGGGNVITAN